MPEDFLTNLPVAPEILAGTLVLLIVFIILRRITARKQSRLAEQAPAQSVVAPGDHEDANAGIAEAEDTLPSVLYPMPVIGLIEERMFDALEDIAGESVLGHRVMMQLAASAFLYGGAPGRSRAQDPATVRQLSQLQVDFLIVDAEWRPVLAIDLERDAISASDKEERKRLALDRAGIAYLIAGAEGLTETQRDAIKRHLASSQGIAAE